MRSENLSAEEALRAVETAHSRADPNPGFRQALLCYMRTCLGAVDK